MSVSQLGKKLSEEHIRKIRATRQSKKVICIAGSRIFASTKEVAEFLDVPRSTITGRLHGRLKNSTSMRYI